MFSLSARYSTGPGHSVNNAGRIYKLANEHYDYKSMAEHMFKNSIHDLYNDFSSCTSASVIFGNKTVPNMAHTTDIMCKGNPPSWEANSHTLQCQGHFVVVENRQMSNANHNNYLSASEASNSSRFTNIGGSYISDSITTIYNNVDTLVSYGEVSSCKEIQQEVLQYGSVYKNVYSLNEGDSSIVNHSDGSLGSGAGDIVPKVNTCNGEEFR